MKILGVRVDNLTINQVLEKIEGFLADGRQHYIVTLNPEFLVKAQKDQSFKQILNQADLALPDGIGLIFAAWFLGQSLKQRIAGVDLMEKICQKAAQNGWPVCLIGGQSDIAQKAGANLKKKYPGLEINQNNPKILFVALGAPKQEKWIVENLKNIPSVKLAIGVGGSFDFISGQVRRAPRLIRFLGLEWLWRLMRQPWRIKRIFRAIIIFPWLVLKHGFNQD
ncbi:MAG: hypothetical protein CMI55_03970 [Parcubacteria group bacterium]|jgi:N-acetylglucosaminyldiphosphoundecaprenol N-acetyl-beta-D-mannosaminyltransferase|nr:hypothetical protein [Parcubacteria group bacterium]|tara:strand:+ start:196 stop:864 length:669 start_codon:yes stop_codon:yes gene_type:complete